MLAATILSESEVAQMLVLAARYYESCLSDSQIAVLDRRAEKLARQLSFEKIQAGALEMLTGLYRREIMKALRGEDHGEGKMNRSSRRIFSRLRSKRDRPK